MINLETLLLFLIPMLIINISPGPAMIYTATQTAAYGRSTGIVSVMGLESGTFFHVIVATIGLSAIIIANPHLIIAIQVLGALYLIYLGIKEIKPQNEIAIAQQGIKKNISRWKVFKQGFVINLLNPKVSLFFLAFLPPFIDTSRDDVAQQFFTLGVIFNLSGTVFNIIVVFLVAWLGRFFVKKLDATEHNWLKNGLLAFVYITLALVILIRTFL